MNTRELLVLQRVRAAETTDKVDPLDARLYADDILACIDEGWLVLGGTLQHATLTLTPNGLKVVGNRVFDPQEVYKKT